MHIRLQLNPLILYRTILTRASTILTSKTPVSLSFKIIGVGTTDPDAPPIFVLHGLLDCKRNWTGIGKTIYHMTKRTVVTVDLRNHGSSPHISSNKYIEMAADLVQLFDKLHVDKASLVGYDIGGRMAMCASLTTPNKVAGLVVVDISPASTSDHMKSMIKILKAMKTVNFKNSKKVSRAKKEAKRQLKEIVNDDAIMYRILSNVKVKNDGIIGWGCNLDAFIKHFNQFLSFPKSMKGKKYDGPCVLIGGQLSEYIPADDLTKIRELFPQVVVRYIVKTTHDLHLEDPRSFLELVIAFLETNN